MKSYVKCKTCGKQVNVVNLIPERCCGTNNYTFKSNQEVIQKDGTTRSSRTIKKHNA